MNDCSEKITQICEKIINEPIPKSMLEVTKCFVETTMIMQEYIEGLTEMIIKLELRIKQLEK